MLGRSVCTISFPARKPSVFWQGSGHDFAAGGRDHSNRNFDKLCRQCGQPLVLAGYRAIFDRHVLSNDKTGLPQALAERRDQGVGRSSGDVKLR
jgi:hypothetical protein